MVHQSKVKKIENCLDYFQNKFLCHKINALYSKALPLKFLVFLKIINFS